MSTILKPVYLVDALGELARLPDGAIINIGGTSGPTFTVAGKPLLFADGTATDGSVVPGFQIPDFQTVYGASVGEAFIDFTSGKDFVLHAVNNKEFRFDADTGLVTITGDLTVLGDTTAVITTSVMTDKVIIHQTAGNYIPFVMEPVSGVTPSVNVVDIKVAYGGASVFTIDPAGVTHISNLDVGLVNGVDFSAFKQAFDDHVSISSPGVKHTAAQISVDPASLTPLVGNNVQEVLESVAQAISSGIGSVQGFELVQTTASDVWYAIHNGGTRRVQITVWDENDEIVYPERVSAANDNSVTIFFNTPMTGRAVLMLF